MIRTGLDETLFPGIPSEVSVHDGFRRVHAKTAIQILAEVKRLLNEKKTKNIITVRSSFEGIARFLSFIGRAFARRCPSRFGFPVLPTQLAGGH